MEDNITTDTEPDTTEAASEQTSNVTRNENPIVGDVLSKQDVQALREATSVQFSYDPNTNEAKITARKESSRNTWGAVMERPISNVEGVVKIHDEAALDPKQAAIVIDTETVPEWKTIAESLRENDQVALVFHLGLQNEVLNSNGISWDRFSLEVQRFDGRGRGALRTFTFNVIDSFGQGETNRMFSWH